MASSGRGRRWSIACRCHCSRARSGRRRSWLLLAQLVVAGGLVGLALADPAQRPASVGLFALVVAFGSATQDIALDAYRIESARVDKQAALAAMYQTGYRLAMIWAGAGVLWIAARAAGDSSGADLGDRYAPGAWTIAYLVMAPRWQSASSPCCSHPSRWLASALARTGR
jgi:MFS transporter, PAT family, beta-lactamase induction signal transducer AmpG